MAYNGGRSGDMRYGESPPTTPIIRYVLLISMSSRTYYDQINRQIYTELKDGINIIVCPTIHQISVALPWSSFLWSITLLSSQQRCHIASLPTRGGHIHVFIPFWI